MLIRRINGEILETSEGNMMQEVRIGDEIYYKPIGELHTKKWNHLNDPLVVREEGEEAFICRVNVVGENKEVYAVRTGRRYGTYGGDTKYEISHQCDGKAIVCALDKEGIRINKVYP